MPKAELFDCRVYGSMNALMAGFCSGGTCLATLWQFEAVGLFGPGFVNMDLTTRALQRERVKKSVTLAGRAN